MIVHSLTEAACWQRSHADGSEGHHMARHDGETPLGASGHRTSTSALLPFTPTPHPEGGGQRVEPLHPEDGRDNGVKRLHSEAGTQEERLMALEEVPYTLEPIPDIRNSHPYNSHL